LRGTLPDRIADIHWSPYGRRIRFCVLLAYASSSSPFTGFFGLVFIAVIIVAVIAFFRGPARAADNYVNALSLQFQNPADSALFRNIYRTKQPKNVVVAWVLTVFLSPTISYIYQGKWGLALIAFLTLQGLFIWWLVSMFTMPMEVMNSNKKLADEAFNQVMISRPGTATQ
jgi:hypothetical protein